MHEEFFQSFQSKSKKVSQISILILIFSTF
jgi:hypothetical protein